MFRIIEKYIKDIKNIITSLNHMASFIDKRNIKNNKESNLPYMEGFGQAA